MSKNDQREERDLLIELKTTVGGMREEIVLMRSEIKDINTGATARILNLETNAVSKIVLQEVENKLEALSREHAELKNDFIDFRSRVIGWGSAAVLGMGAISTILGLLIK